MYIAGGLIGDELAVTYALRLDIALSLPLVLLILGIGSLVEDHIGISLEGEDVRTDTVEEPTVV